MTDSFSLVKPRFIPPLDDEFCPAVLANRAFEQESAAVSVPLIIGLERDDGKLSRFEARVFPEDHPGAETNLYYAERMLKFLLWQRGGSRVYVGGSRSIGDYLQNYYAAGGKRDFDYHFMSEQVYERPFSVELCEPEQVPPANDVGEALGRHLEGCRIGFDLGASDRKVSAVIDGRVVYSEEVIWDPRGHTDPEYHYREIITAIKTAAAKMPRVDAIGGSSAGIFIDNRPMVASLFRGIPPERFHEIRHLFLRIRDELNIPLEVINDGDVTALAGSMSLEDNGILGIAMGSSQAAGYIDMHGCIMGWLNELCFAPIDYSPTAPIDEWSGDTGCGSQYLSQQCVFRLAPRAGIKIPSNLSDAEKLKFVQEKLEAGHTGAVKIWQSIGIYLGYALAHYADFYDMKHVLILGRCTSGLGGTLILDEACKVLKTEFPELASRLQVQLPDERSRRVGQSIAAASLPIVHKGTEQAA
ncbi:MAG: transcriptional regulator [Chloroflexi bacterium RBG_19FT_COMBO_49_13]|nr:MAG: transcriptional regulator [Chloroflexi bacterium RBG_19FT_COMBO_49_13]